MLRFCQASILAAFGFAAGIFPAFAQWDPPPQPGSSAASPWDPTPQQVPPCVQAFTKLRDDAQKKAGAIRAASERKAAPKEACGLFNAFSAAEAKLVKYAADNVAGCGIPPEVVKNLQQQHKKTVEIQGRVCQAAASPPRPAGPSLSDALGSGAVPDVSNIRTGRGTYDTLTGTPLGNK